MKGKVWYAFSNMATVYINNFFSLNDALLAVLGFHCCTRLSLAVVGGGYSLVVPLVVVAGRLSWSRHLEPSWTRAQTHLPWVGRQILKHCISRELHKLIFLEPNLAVGITDMLNTSISSLGYSLCENLLWKKKVKDLRACTRVCLIGSSKIQVLHVLWLSARSFSFSRQNRLALTPSEMPSPICTSWLSKISWLYTLL